MASYQYPDVTADDLFESAGIGPNGELRQSDGSVPSTQEEEDTVETQNFLMASRAIGLLQTKPMDKQQAVFHELAAKYLPRIVEAYRKRRTPNNAPECLLNYIAFNPYFMRFSKTPQGADLPRIHALRMTHVDLLPSENEQTTVAEVCQFLSTLFVVYNVDHGYIEDSDREILLRKLKAWREEYRGKFAEETTGRCIDMLEPFTTEGKQMTMMMMMMRLTWGLGVEMCAIKGCKNKKEEKDLLQCGKCKTMRYCGPEHQKQDWPNHKSKCYPPVF